MIFGEDYSQLAASGEYEVYKKGTTLASLNEAIAGLSDEEYLDSFLIVNSDWLNMDTAMLPIVGPRVNRKIYQAIRFINLSATYIYRIQQYDTNDLNYKEIGVKSDGTGASKDVNAGTLNITSWTLYRRQKSYDVTISGSKAASAIAPVQDSLATANRNYAVGEQFYYDGHLYKVIANIVSGAQIVLGTNAVLTDDVTTQMKPKVLKTSTSSASVTLGDKLLELKSTYQSLTDYEKQKAFLIYNNIYKFNVSQISGQFFCAFVDSSSGFRTVIADIVNGKYLQTRVSLNSNVEYSDGSSTTAALAISLCIMG